MRQSHGITDCGLNTQGTGFWFSKPRTKPRINNFQNSLCKLSVNFHFHSFQGFRWPKLN